MPLLLNDKGVSGVRQVRTSIRVSVQDIENYMSALVVTFYLRPLSSSSRTDLAMSWST